MGIYIENGRHHNEHVMHISSPASGYKINAGVNRDTITVIEKYQVSILNRIPPFAMSTIDALTGLYAEKLLETGKYIFAVLESVRKTER